MRLFPGLFMVAFMVPDLAAMTPTIECVLRATLGDRQMPELFRADRASSPDQRLLSDALIARYLTLRSVTDERERNILRRQLIQEFRTRFESNTAAVEQLRVDNMFHRRAAVDDNYFFDLFETNYWRRIREDRRRNRTPVALERQPSEVRARIEELRRHPTPDTHRAVARAAAAALRANGVRVQVFRIYQRGIVVRYEVRIVPPEAASMRVGHHLRVLSRLAYSLARMSARVAFTTDLLVTDQDSWTSAAADIDIGTTMRFELPDRPFATVYLPWQDLFSDVLSVEARHELKHYFDALYMRHDRAEYRDLASLYTPRVGAQFELAWRGAPTGIYQVEAVMSEVDRIRVRRMDTSDSIEIAMPEWIAASPRLRIARVVSVSPARAMSVDVPLPYLYFENLPVVRTGSRELYSSNRAHRHAGNETSTFTYEARAQLQSAKRLEAPVTRVSFHLAKSLTAVLDALDFLDAELPALRRLIDQLNGDRSPNVDAEGGRITGVDRGLIVEFESRQFYRRIQELRNSAVTPIPNLTTDDYANVFESIVAVKLGQLAELQDIVAQVRVLLEGIPARTRYRVGAVSELNELLNRFHLEPDDRL